MSSSESDAPPPDSAPPDSPPERGSSFPGPSGKESRRRRLEGVIPEIVRRAVELGVEKATDAPENLKNFVGDMKLPKEIAHYLFSQIDETKNGLFRVVAKEMRDFLEHTNFAGEVQKLLTTVQFEVNTTIRFTPNDGADKKKDKKGSTPPSSSGGGEDTSSREHRPSDDDENGSVSDSGSTETTKLPRPEVKTQVHVRRDRDRDREERRK